MRSVAKKSLLTVVAASLILMAPATPGFAGSKKLNRIIGGVIGGIIIHEGIKHFNKKKRKNNKIARTPSNRVVKSNPERQVAQSKGQSNKFLGQTRLALAQTGLAALGFYVAKIDGKDGSGTQQAVSKYQSEYGYEITGVITPEQYRELASIANGSQSPAVVQSDDNLADPSSNGVLDFLQDESDTGSPQLANGNTGADGDTDQLDLLELPDSDGNSEPAQSSKEALELAVAADAGGSTPADAGEPAVAEPQEAGFIFDDEYKPGKGGNNSNLPEGVVREVVTGEVAMAGANQDNGKNGAQASTAVPSTTSEEIEADELPEFKLPD